MNIYRIYWFMDEFAKQFNEWNAQQSLLEQGQRQRHTRLSLAELLTIVIMFGYSPIKNFKWYYTHYLPHKYPGYFTPLSYHRLLELLPRLLLPLIGLLHSLKGKQTGVYFVDSTKLAVCHNKRTDQHKVFKGLANLGKSSMGWFFGFKLHLLINHYGQLMGAKITRASVDDREPLPNLLTSLRGLCFADKGYIKAHLFSNLYKKGLKLVTPIRTNMTNKLIPLHEKLMLKKRSVIESVFNVLKSQFNIEHSRHRSPLNAFVHILAALVGYCFKSSKHAIANFTSLMLIPS